MSSSSRDAPTMPPPLDPHLAAFERLDAKLDAVLASQARILLVLQNLASEVADLHEFRRKMEVEKCKRLPL